MAEEQIDLLLADPRTYMPRLEAGIADDAALQATKPKKDQTQLRRDKQENPNLLSAQRWGVVVPEGKEGDALLEAMKPLIDYRSEEQGAKSMVFRVKPQMNRDQVSDWLYNVYEDNDLDEKTRPYYLCILGNTEQASLDFQQTIVHNALTGRVHFEKPDGTTDLDAYAAYAEKVVQYASNNFTRAAPNLIYYVAPDGTRATRNAIPKLVAPSVESSQRDYKNGDIVAEVLQLNADSVDSFLAATATMLPNGKPRPSVLMTVSHGLGGSVDDYGSVDAQRRRQGALVLGSKEILDADAIAKKTFLPGGLWFCFACFGAGTPATSEYYRWLGQLAQTGDYQESVKAVLSSLAPIPDGFIAAMPQAALRNPNGPLAVVGHIDLAWNFAYTDPRDTKVSRSAKFTRALHAMSRGARIGSAFNEITEWFRSTNHDLTSMYSASETARIDKREDPTNPRVRARTWLLRNDLRGYVLLGDPAVRLAQAEDPELQFVRPIPKAGSESQTNASADKAANNKKDTAVRALLEGNQTPRAIAEKAGCSITQLFAWLETYRALEREKQA